MYIRYYPEDSVLRRHFEATADRTRGDWLRQPPTDSVLRRHYDQMMHPGALPASQAVPRVAARGPEPTVQAPAAEADRRGGLLGWLGRLFG